MSATVTDPVLSAGAFANEAVTDFTTPANQRRRRPERWRRCSAQLGREYDLLIAGKRSQDRATN